MFKWFGDFLTATEKHRCLSEISSIEKESKASLVYAKTVANDLVENVEVLSQFFDIKPKIGEFGICKKDESDTVATLNEERFDGVVMKIYTTHEGIKGVSFTEMEDD